MQAGGDSISVDQALNSTKRRLQIFAPPIRAPGARCLSGVRAHLRVRRRAMVEPVIPPGGSISKSMVYRAFIASENTFLGDAINKRANS